MSLNPFTTFQKNKRFWMAAVLMICMISFVFCTGIKGGFEDYIFAVLGGRGGDSIARVAGRNVSSKELSDLKNQRELANAMLKRCASEAFNKISKVLFEQEKKKVSDKEMQRRQQELTQLYAMRESLAHRKSRAHYFDTGWKFDELLEFMLWQAEADRLGIRLDPDHVRYLYHAEFYSVPGDTHRVLSPEEVFQAERDARGEIGAGASFTSMERAITEEFRVKIAQYAVMGAQPYSFFFRGKRQDELQLKFSTPDVPDELRVPLTLAQLYDVYKQQRAEFDVTLIPVHVDDFIKGVKIPEPKDYEAIKAKYFNDNKRPYDPTSPTPGIEVPSRIKIEFVMADPTSPGYLNLAKAKVMMEVASPLAWNPTQSGLVNVARYAAAAEMEMKVHLQRHYEALSRGKGERYLSASMGTGAGTAAMATYFAHRSPEAAASLVGRSFFGSGDGLAGLSGYMAYGALATPLQKGDPKVEPAYRPEIVAGARAVARQRAPFYAMMVPVPGPNAPLNALLWMHLNRQALSEPTELPVEVVQADIRDMIARRQAEEWARDSMQIVKRALEGATGNDAPEKFKRVLDKLVPELKLTYGPTEAAKANYYHRYNVDDAKELEPLKESFLKSIDTINLFEGRDITPERILKTTDFYKMFFEDGFGATAPYTAKPWPPMVTPDKARAWKKPNPRLINEQNINPEVGQNFRQFIMQNDPHKNMPSFDLFNNAEKPILFWRTEQPTPYRPVDFTKIPAELTSIRADLAKLGTAKKTPAVTKQISDLKLKESELEEIITRVTEGWLFERARADALPKAKAIAEAVLKSKNSPNEIDKHAKELNRPKIELHKLSRMYPERLPNFDQDYFEYTLPKEQFVHPRDDMARQLVNLYDLTTSGKDKAGTASAIEIKDEELDKINRDLFNHFKEDKNPQGQYVQILTNKPRSVFYIAVVTGKAAPDRSGFAKSVEGAPYERRVLRDHFVTRAHQLESRKMRADIVRALGERLGYSDISDEARKRFDKDGVE